MEPRQTSLDDLREGGRLRDLGMSQAEDHDYEDWLPLAREVAFKLFMRQGEVTADDVIAVIGFPPGHRNLIGSIFSEKKWVVWTYRRSTRKERHAGVIGVWRLR